MLTRGKVRLGAIVAGALIGVFQLVGRTDAAQLVGVDGGSRIGELRLWVLTVLSLWLCAAVAVRGPRFRRFQVVKVRSSGRMIVLFVMYMIATILWAPNWALAQAKAYDLLFVAWSCTLTVVSLGIFGHRATVDGLRLSLLGLGLLLAGVGLSAVSSGEFEGRLAVFGGGPNVYGRNMGLLALAASPLVLDARRWVRAPAAVLASLAGLLVLLSGSRGAMVALFLAAIAYLGSQQWDRRLVRSILFVAVIGAVVLATQIGKFAVLMFQERVIILLLVERYFTHRDTLWSDGIKAGIEQPLGGIGLAGFVELESEGSYPHNMFVEAFAEGGALGLLLLFVPFVTYFRRWKSGMGVGNPVVFAVLVLLLVSSSISGDLFDARGVFLFLLMAIASQADRTYARIR